MVLRPLQIEFFRNLLVLPTYAQPQAPQISNLTPISGAVGTPVTIAGTNFGATPGTSTVTFNGTTATPSSWSASSVTVAVPPGATTGNVVVTVGGVSSNSATFTVATANLTLTGSLATARMFHTATLLNSGTVLVAGGVDGFAYDALSSAELYSPVTATFTTTGNLNTARIFNTATLLTNGQVLIAGGSDSNWNQIGTAELYDPASGIFTFTGSLNGTRTSHTATLLNNGKVLMVGGWNSSGGTITSDAAGSELYDPTAGTFVSSGTLNTPRDTHTATLLNDGTVLIVGGFDSNSNILSSAELYDPAAGTFTVAGSLNFGRAVHTATLLNNGMVLIAGGYDTNGNAVASAELYDPATGSFTVTGSMNTPRYDGAQGTLLNNGMVLLAGGQDNNGNTLVSAELYDPATGTFTVTGSMNATRQSLTTTVLSNGQVLVTAGMDYYANVLNNAELYQPSTLIPAGLVSIAVSPSNPSISVGTTEPFTATGTFSDNSTQTLASVTWTSSDTTIATISNDASDRGNAVAVATGSATVSACTGSLCGSTTVTVLPPPSITGLLPISGSVGTVVTIAGNNFGTTGSVTFNGTIATPTSWAETSITAPVPVGATTGNVVVTVGGVQSNWLNFTVTTAALLNTGRYQHSATLLNNGKVLIAGGVNCPTAGFCTYLNSAELYDPTAGNSVTTGSLGTARVAPSVLLTNGKVLIAGGSTCSSNGNCASLSSAEIYDPASGTFASGGNMEVARNSHTMTLLSDGKVLITGGETCSASYGGGSENRPAEEPLFGDARLVYASFTPTVGSISCSAQGTAELYDPTTNSFAYTSGSLNVARYNAAGVRLADGRVLIVGGSDEYRPLWSAEIYNESANSFSEVPTGLGTARSSPVATLLNNGLVLITGGSTCEAPICPTNTAELFDPTANAFEYTSGAMNMPRVGHTANLLTNGQVVLAGGNSSCAWANSCTAELSTESYDPASSTFSGTQAMTTARSGQTGTLLSNGSVLLAGGIASRITLSSIELYQPSSFAPAELVSIAVTPANGSMGIEGLQQFVAIGTFSDGSTSTLQSVVWVSSNPTVASINNAAGSLGFAFGLSFGSTTITATAGTISGSATLTVQLPVQSGGFVTTRGQMQASLYGQTATQLTAGQVLIAGGMSTSGVVNSAELYTPAGQSFAAANAMNVARWLHTATLMNDGTVLVAGGSDLANEETLDSAEIYNPATGTFTLLSNTLNTARVGHTATLMGNGQVLIVGGYDPETGLIADAELYDPPTQTFIDLGDTKAPRYAHTATVLQNGQVLIAGGETDPIPTAAYNTAEIFDLPSQTFKLVPVPMISTREGHAAVLLNNGQVLITGGDIPGTGSLNTAEIYDPISNTFAAVTSLMTVPRVSHVMTVLNGGKVLIMGGATDSPGSSTALYAVEFYDPASRTFAAVGDMASAREHQTASLLNNGTVLIAGGTDGTNIFNTAELYTSSQLNGLTSIAITPAAPTIGAGAQQRFTAVGTFSTGSTQNLSSVLWSSSSASIAPVSGDATNPGVAATTAQGTTTITASAVGVGGSATLTVTAPALASITVSPQGATIPLGATQQFTATGVYTDGSTQDLTGTATWSSSATVVAAINSSGLAAGLFQGTATIQVNSGSLSASATLSVAAPALVSIAVNPATATVPLGTSQQYQAIGTYSDGSTQDVTTLVAWSSAVSTVATVSGTGLALGVSQGTTTLTATFESIAATVPLTVGPPSLASLSIAPDAASLSIGTTQQLSATGTYSDGSTQNLTVSSTWASSNPSVISVSSAGLATAVAAGNATITATSGSTSGTAALVVTTGTTQANLNTSRYQHSATILNNGQILVAGGINCPTSGSCTYLSSAELYNPATSAFVSTGGAMATARSAPAVQLNSGKVLVAGGYTCDGSGNCSSLNSAEIYDPTAGTFSSAGTMTVARSGHTMTVFGNGTVLIAGGQNCTSATSCSVLQSAEIYDPNAGTFTSTTNIMSAARFGASAVLLNSGSVLIAGGFDGTNLPAAAEIYNPTYYGTYGAFTWAGPSLTVPRFDATAILLNNGQVLVSGGSTCNLPGCPTNAAEIYDPVANTFSSIPAGMNVPRFNHTATLTTNGDVVVAGGYSSCGSSCTGEASTEFFDPVAGTFSSGQPVTTALAGHTGTLLANGNVLLIGGINAGVTLASDEWYQPTSFTPAGLVSVTVAPANLFLAPGQTQQMVATGTFNDGSTQTLQSVIWNSSNSSAAVISNSPGSAVIVNALATGATTLTATAGDVGGSASLNVAGLVSLAITPANPSITVGASQQFTATGTFSDGSQRNWTTSVTWSSSNTSTVVISSTTGLQGFAMGAAVGTSTITAALGSTQATTLVTVQAPVTPIPPYITSVSPPAGEAGTQVTISGTGFGPTQGTGAVWLGSTYGAVVTWTGTQIVATVTSISRSGTAQVQQGGLSSNAVQFNVNTATILNVSPASGVPGTQVTITGSGFGATQGSGQVFLGTANGLVQSWADNQVVAVVGAGSTSGNALILQNGVMSNAVPFSVNALHIASVTPNSGGPGTSVTITGTGFGWNQGNGTVWLGGTNGQVVSWSNTQVVAVVAANAVTGVVRIEQNGVLSNALTFTVPASNAVTLNPNMLNLVAGQTQTIQALDASGQPVTGLTWASSNLKVVSLSTDDPPILTALTAGHVTITAGSASADVTVYYGTLPTGTVIWSNPGDGSGVIGIVPAVPSATGVADVFALNADCTVQAITSNGSVAWTANIGQPPQYGEGGACNEFMPDFQGGFVVKSETTNPPNSQESFRYHLQKFDGMTGQAYPAYDLQSEWWINMNFQGLLGIGDHPWIRSYSPTVVHTDGTIFAIDHSGGDDVYGFPYGIDMVDVIDPLTGGQKAQIGAGNGVGNLIVAGDGYAYVPYTFYTGDPTCPGVGKSNLGLLRMDTAGGSSSTTLGSWDVYCTANNQSGTVADPTAVNIITNADQGVLVSWELQTASYSPGWGPTSTTYYIAAVSGGSLMAQGPTNQLVQPVLQAQDGSFYGTTYAGGAGGMVKFDRSGNIQWSVPGDSPRIATVDGGVVGASGITYDNNGRATGQVGLPVQSWTANTYQYGSVEDTLAIPAAPATPPYSSFAGVNQSLNLTSPLCHDSRDQLVAEYGNQSVGDIYYGRTPLPRFTPSCFLLTNSAHSFYFTFSEINTSCPSQDYTPEFGWALIKYPLIAPSTIRYGLDAWRENYGASRFINSGYRDPVQNVKCGSVAPGSRHQFGDAVDLRNQSGGLTEWNNMVKAANDADADYVEDQTEPCGLGCVHADWRYHDRGMYNTATIAQ